MINSCGGFLKIKVFFYYFILAALLLIIRPVLDDVQECLLWSVKSDVNCFEIRKALKLI